MRSDVKMPVSVSFYHNHRDKKSYPVAFRWEGELRKIERVDLHHFFRVGRTLFHAFSVYSNGGFFRLVFNTDNLSWEVDEISYE